MPRSQINFPAKCECGFWTLPTRIELKLLGALVKTEGVTVFCPVCERPYVFGTKGESHAASTGQSASRIDNR
jgi:hypothetical protein